MKIMVILKRINCKVMKKWQKYENLRESPYNTTLSYPSLSRGAVIK